jgi:hypothetical protein
VTGRISSAAFQYWDYMIHWPLSLLVKRASIKEGTMRVISALLVFLGLAAFGRFALA